jgi:hypothetical protein
MNYYKFSIFIFLLNLIFNNFSLLTISKNDKLVDNYQQLLNDLQPGTGNQNEDIYFSEDKTILKFINQNLTDFVDLSISKFKNLRFFDLSNNQITTIIGCNQLFNLKEIKLDNN